MTRLRVLVHALDRTGPPVLARTFLRWLAHARPDVGVEVAAFRGGPLLDDFLHLGPTVVMVDPHEPWDHDAPDGDRVAEIRRRASFLEPADATLLVSVAGGQCLPHLDRCGPVLTWVVEQGDDLHWVDGPIGAVLRQATARWLAGSTGSRHELGARLGRRTEVSLVPEFVDMGAGTVDPADVERRRRALGVLPGELLVLGAGIATRRKAPDLFVEVAAASARRDLPVRFTWLGGEADPLFFPLQHEVRRIGIADRVRFLGSVDDVTPWLAAADVCLHPARLDAFPLVALHAAAAGTPVLGFAGVGGLEEMFGPTFAGVPAHDVDALACALGEWSDPVVRRQVGEAQRRFVLERFSAHAAAPALLREIERVAA